METLTRKAGVLIEALPYIRTFFGKTFVIKYGGSAMIDPELKRAVALDVILLKYVGVNPVVVHGGGPEISRLMRRVGKEPIFVDGLRVTDADTMDLVQMALLGKVNAELVSLINANGGSGLGLSGLDGRMLTARKRTGGAAAPEEGGNDLGQVGDIAEVRPELISLLAEQGFIPVVATVTADRKGTRYNVNADAAAGELAVALEATKLIMLTDVEGISPDPDEPGRVVSNLETAAAREMISDGRIGGGMIPKVEACIRALEGGVPATHILDGRALHSLLLEIFTDRGIGTMVVP